MTTAHFLLSSGVIFGVSAFTLATPGLRAAGPPQVQELRTQQVGGTTYFHVRLASPADLRLPRVEPGPSSELRRRQLARLPQLVPQDRVTSAVYQRLAVPHFRPSVGFSADRQEPVPVQGLEFVGKVQAQGKVKWLLQYPTGEEASSAAKVQAQGGLAGLVRRASWAEVPLELDFATARRVPRNGASARRRPEQPPGPDDLEGLWAEGQAGRLAVLETLAPDFGFYGFACAATGRKYGVADPVLEGERARDRDKLHRRLFELTTGSSAITQSLALRRFLDADYRDRGARTVDVATVRGIEIAEHPWQKMMGSQRPAPEPLARLVPHDNYYLYFRDIRKLIALGELLDQWGTSAARAFEGNSRDYRLRERYERQLCLRSTWLGKTLGPLAVRGVAITGNDPYVREGTDVTILFHVTNRPFFLAAVEPFLQEARKELGGRLSESQEEYHGITVERFVTPLREVSLHRASFGDFVAYSNSAAGLRRVLDTHQGRLKALGDSLDFQYMRTAFPLGDRQEDGFGFLSDAFLRQLVGSASKIKEKRRLEALTSLQMVTHGALFAAWENGRLPEDHRDLLAAARLKPEHLYVPEGKGITWDSAQQVAVSDAYNTLHFATPLVELPIDRITPGEERAYLQFREEYTRLWRQFFDPVGLRFALDDRQVRAEVYILPLINNNEYNTLRTLTGDGSLRFDPATLSPQTLVQLTVHLRRNWFFGDAFGNWALIRLDDSPVLARLARLWVRQDLDPESRAQLEPDALRAVWRLPLTVGIRIGEEKAFDALLKNVQTYLGPARSKTFKHQGVPITRLRFGADSQLARLPELQGRPSPATIYHAKIDGGWYASLSKRAVEDLIDRAAERRAGKGPARSEAVLVNSSLHVAPQAAVQAGPALQSYLEWETHKRALPNNALWYALYRCGLVAEGTAEPARCAVALQYFGFVPVSPDDAAYTYDPRAGEVVNDRHGSLRRPRLHATLAESSPLARVLEQLPSLRADMRFREDGLHSTLTVNRKAGR